MHYVVLHNFDNPLFATHLLVHEKSIQNINSILIKNKCRRDLYKFVNKYLLKHNKIFYISVTYSEIYMVTHTIYFHMIQKICHLASIKLPFIILWMKIQ